MHHHWETEELICREDLQDPGGLYDRRSCLIGLDENLWNAGPTSYGTMAGSAFLITSVRRCRTGVNPL